MSPTEIVTIALCIGLMAVLYSSVGHGGASGYIAVMTLFGFHVDSIRPTALVLNLMVSSVGLFQFWRAGHFTWQHLWPFAVTSIPLSFYGARLNLPTAIIHSILGLVLISSAVRLLLPIPDPAEPKPPSKPTAFGVGALIGLLSGLTGTGGGIFLTPTLLICRWASTKQAAALSVGFILVNSLAGLCGHLSRGKPIPHVAWWLAASAVSGGVAGAYLGSRRLHTRSIQLLLVIVLLTAGYKLLMPR